MMIRNLSAEHRQELEDAVSTRPVVSDEGLKAPSWWHGEEDAAASAATFMSGFRR